MPRPLRKIPPPKPSDIVIRHVGSNEPVEIVAPDELERRKDEAMGQRYSARHGLDMVDEHARLALAYGAVITVPAFHADLWWFVLDVNGPERTITAATLLFDQLKEATLPFDAVAVPTMFPLELNEAGVVFDRIRVRLPAQHKRQVRERHAA